MTWIEVATLMPGLDWIYSPGVSGSLFRVRHTASVGLYVRGLICQASETNPRELFGIKRLYPKAEADIYQFPQPDCFDSRCLGVKSKFYVPNQTWQIGIDVWQPGTTVNRTEVASSGTWIEILDANVDRKGATIFNRSTFDLYID